MESFEIPKLSSPIGVVGHDTGGTNQILAILRHINDYSVLAYMEGPAKILWDTAFPCNSVVNNLSELLAKTSTLITGTGWGSNLEHVARIDAKKKGIYSIAVLDHWTNYEERFIRGSEMVLPDELWVVDEYALQLARNIFPSLKITLIHDFYADQQVKMIAPKATANELLYLLEPMRSDWGRGELGEFQALRYFFKNLHQLSLPADTVIRLRPHPSDPPGKYDRFLGEFTGFLILLDTGNLSDSLSRARWVVGCQTYAMTLALKSNRTVYCSLPPWAPPCKLPHDGLIHIKGFVSA
ncbi:hypothetical protein FP507_02340 [Chlorobium phaeovibrioides]|uniref:Uncharacterized protein n=1 Tax=Chlorobium phaeovibrioides TaxID=1094 RepID=A0A5M8IAI2_CHLPH|nr:hypothetical protein [Chlorobium phaeovibrioides]KAA6232067.1 hypothetical protein FP507_02340 [Chlorobium phaeovibrioides]